MSMMILRIEKTDRKEERELYRSSSIRTIRNCEKKAVNATTGFHLSLRYIDVKS